MNNGTCKHIESLNIKAYEQSAGFAYTTTREGKTISYQRYIVVNNTGYTRCSTMIRDPETGKFKWYYIESHELCYNEDDKDKDKIITDEKILKMCRRAYNLAFQDEEVITRDQLRSIIKQLNRMESEVKERNYELFKQYKAESVKHLEPLKVSLGSWSDLFQNSDERMILPFYSQKATDFYPSKLDIISSKSYVQMFIEWDTRSSDITKDINTVKQILKGSTTDISDINIDQILGALIFKEDTNNKGEVTTLTPITIKKELNTWTNGATQGLEELGVIIANHTIKTYNRISKPYNGRFYKLEDVPERYRLIALEFFTVKSEELWGIRDIYSVVRENSDIAWYVRTVRLGNKCKGIEFEPRTSHDVSLNKDKLRTIEYALERGDYHLASFNTSIAKKCLNMGLLI